MSRDLDSEDLNRITTYLSRERLETFLNLANSLEDAILLHQATMRLAAPLMAVSALLEIALRNTVCSNLSHAFNKADWLRSPPAPFRWGYLERTGIDKAERQAKRAAYSKLSNKEKVALNREAFALNEGQPPNNLNHRLIAQRRQETIQVPEGQIVAQLTMFFWKRLFSENYEKTLWKRGLKKVFPNKTYTRAHIASQLEVLYETRNRLAHHEPVYGSRLEDALKVIEFISSNLDSRHPNPESSLAKLIKPQQLILNQEVEQFRSIFESLRK